jgi:hypothetical protein
LLVARWRIGRNRHLYLYPYVGADLFATSGARHHVWALVFERVCYRIEPSNRHHRRYDSVSGVRRLLVPLLRL